MIGVWLSATAALAAPQMSVEVHDRWIAGHRIQLAVRIENTESAEAAVPDLANRPWLVRFDTVDPSGARRTVHSTAPETDPGGTIALGSGQTRVTRFEVPTSEGWTAGGASITVSVGGEAIGTHRIVVNNADPTWASDTAKPVDKTGPGSQLISVPANGRTDLFIKRQNTLEFVTTIDEPVTAQLSVARADQRIGRWVTWQGKSGTLWTAQQGAHGLQSAPHRVTLPWPDASPCGRAATAGSGHMVIPVCIRSPKGAVTKTTAMVMTPRGQAQFRTIGSYEATTILTNVDAAGSVEFVLVRDNAIDWSWLGTDTAAAFPASIKQVWRGAHVHSVRLGLTQTDPPSPAVFFTVEGEQAERTQASPR
jgi:hypothetical protein